MLRRFLRPLAWAFPRLRRLHSAPRQASEEVRYDPSLLVPKVTGYEQVNVAYRCAPKGDPILEATHDFFATLVWFWIFYNLYHNHGMLYEHHPPPDPEKWTDEELGLPPEE